MVASGSFYNQWNLGGVSQQPGWEDCQFLVDMSTGLISNVY